MVAPFPSALPCLAAASLLLSGCSTPAATQAQALPPLPADSVLLEARTLLRPAATQGDLQQLRQALLALHPGLTRYQSRAEFEARVDSLHQWFVEPRSRGETYLALARLTAAIRCGHTYLNFWNQPRATRRWLMEGQDKLPFTFTLAADDRWVVVRSAVLAPGDSGTLLLRPGDTVLAVNGLETPALVARLLPLLRGDGANDGKRRSLLEFRSEKRFEATDALLPLIAPPVAGHYTLRVRREGGRDTTLVVAAIDAARRSADARPVPVPRPAWSVGREGAVATLTVAGFEGGEGGRNDAWTPFLRQTFRSFRREGVTTLIVDLRRNEGGSDAAAALLLSHLLQAPLDLPRLRRYVVYDTVPRNLRPLLSTWDDSFYDRRGTTRLAADGLRDLKDGGDWPARLTPAPDAFAGRVLVLTSPINSSASHIMLRLLARQPGVTLVGEPTGGSLRGSNGGNLFFLRLPATGFEVDIPLIGYDWGAEQPSGGVVPDLAVPVDQAMTRARRLAGLGVGS